MPFDISSLTFVSTSQGKIRELREMLGDFSVSETDLPEIQAASETEIIHHKLKTARSLLGGHLFVEDTCLEFEGLGRLPGPYIKWFVLALGNDGLAELVAKLDSQRARAVSTLGCWLDDHTEPEFFRGEVSGTIVRSRGVGFGWDAIFLPDGSEKTFGEMTTSEKRECSHRGKSAKLFRSFLERLGSVRQGQ